MKTSDNQVILLLGVLCCHLANVYAVKTAGTQYALTNEHHVASVQATLQEKGSKLSLEHLQGMEEALVALVLEKASPAVNSAVAQIMDIIANQMKPLVVQRYNVKRLELLAAYSNMGFCEAQLNDALTAPNADLARLETLKTQLESCVWGEYSSAYPKSSYPNNPVVGRGTTPSDGIKLSNISYTDLVCPNPSNPYLCGGWPSTYDPNFPYPVTTGAPESTTTTNATICQNTRDKCNTAKTSCELWESTHYMNNNGVDQTDSLVYQINTLPHPSTTECDRRDFLSVGQYLQAMRDYWNNSIFQTDGWVPLKCQCDLDYQWCLYAQHTCPDADYTIEAGSTFYSPRWLDKMNTSYAQYCDNSSLPPTITTVTTTTTSTSTTTTTSTTCIHCQTSCEDLQNEMDEVACNQTIQRVNQCDGYYNCLQSDNHVSNQTTWSQICGFPNGDRYGIMNEMYGLLRIECVMNALFYNTSAQISASILECRSRSEDYYFSQINPVNITECDNTSVPTNTSGNCSVLTNMSSYPDVSGTVAYGRYYYEHLQYPAPCLSSCCTSLPPSPQVR